MGNPTCPVHQKEMRQGQYGYFCPTKLEDGSWCKWSAKADGNVYEKVPKSAFPASPKPTGNGRSGVDWDKLGKVKALCGMANALLSAGKSPAEIMAGLTQLETLLAAIESKAGVPKSVPTIQVEDGDIPF